MATEVLLIADVRDLGTEGEVVSVSDGFARNYLLPRKLAAPVTEASRRRLEKIRQQRETDRKATHDEACKMASRLGNVSCTIAAKTASEGKLYGSVTAVNIAEELNTQGLAIDKDAIVLDEPIKETGVYNVKVRLHADVEANVKVWVVEE